VYIGFAKVVILSHIEESGLGLGLQLVVVGVVLLIWLLELLVGAGGD